MHEEATIKASAGRWKVSSATSRSHGVRGFQISYWPTSEITLGYSYAAISRQCQQWSLTGFMALSFRGSWLDLKRYSTSLFGCADRARPYLLHSARDVSEHYQPVRCNLGTVASYSRHGLRPAIFAEGCLQLLVSKNYPLLPENRTYRHRYRPDFRTRSVIPRPENRTCRAKKWPLSCTEIVHLLDIPSTVGLLGCSA